MPSRVTVKGEKELIEAFSRVKRDMFRRGIDGVQAATDHLEGASRAWAPNKTGNLEGNIRSEEVFIRAVEGRAVIRGSVTSNTPEYDEYQHRGVRKDGTHRIRQYRKGRKGKGFITGPAREEQGAIERVIAAHLKRVFK